MSKSASTMTQGYDERWPRATTYGTEARALHATGELEEGGALQGSRLRDQNMDIMLNDRSSCPLSDTETVARWSNTSGTATPTLNKTSHVEIEPPSYTHAASRW
ncbi:hypothetical protein LTR37_000239 [Vermiconidia calcicola]|uniref:Uncharacterized protein n=1 Tax=Vermiconidia calcicola TaxID=1690605 RepID=A0ACC3NZT8_9PEZI|nr:hypothetical protein LTR37_000239 [Vermiconidia calcicola]